MDKVALFYNPVAGGGTFPARLDQMIDCLQQAGLQVWPWRIRHNRGLAEAMARMEPDRLHTIVAAGGDGTVHGVVNAMKRLKLSVPLAIFPIGTANDTARNLDLSAEPDHFCRMITEGHVRSVDLGLIEDRYFINVASAGFITDVAHQVSSRAKNLLGKSAYYLKGAAKLPDMEPVSLQVTVDGQEYCYQAIMFVLLNGQGSGGIPEIVPGARMDDGKMDLLIVKDQTPVQFVGTLGNIVLGKPVDASAVAYLRGTRFRLQAEAAMETDLDGEPGPALPWSVDVIPGGIGVRVWGKI
jgi:diacylglycerol kinase (ATP)